VTFLNSSPARWGAPPLPEDAKASLPGCVFASSMTSLTDLTGTVALIVMIKGNFATKITGDKSLNGSYERLL
jgi:hypothetical protein